MVEFFFQNGDPKGEFGCPFRQPLLLFLLFKYFLNFVYTYTVSSQYVYNIYENGWQLVKCLQKSEMYKLYPSTLFISVCQIVFSTCVQQQKKINKIKGWPPWPAKFSFESPFMSTNSNQNWTSHPWKNVPILRMDSLRKTNISVLRTFLHLVSSLSSSSFWAPRSTSTIDFDLFNFLQFAHV